MVLLDQRYVFAAAEIWFHVTTEKGLLQTLVTLHTLREVGAGRFFATYHKGAQEPVLVPLSAIKCATSVRRSERGSLTALWPRAYRCLYEES